MVLLSRKIPDVQLFVVSASVRALPPVPLALFLIPAAAEDCLKKKIQSSKSEDLLGFIQQSMNGSGSITSRN